MFPGSPARTKCVFQLPRHRAHTSATEHARSRNKSSSRGLFEPLLRQCTLTHQLDYISLPLCACMYGGIPGCGRWLWDALGCSGMRTFRKLTSSPKLRACAAHPGKGFTHCQGLRSDASAKNKHLSATLESTRQQADLGNPHPQRTSTTGA